MQTNTDIKPRLLTDEQAATYLCISSRSVKRLRDEGLLPFVPIRGSIRYDMEDVDKFIIAHKSKHRELADQILNEIADAEHKNGKP
jgi:excisionase family DNA binding protein